MLCMNVMKHAQSKWTLQIVFASRKDGLLRLCLQYRKQIAVTVKEAYQSPRMDECLDLLGEGRIFSSFDASFGYLKTENDDQDKDKRHLHRTKDCTDFF